MQQRNIAFTHIFSSDLTRARATADAILDAQTTEESTEEVKAERLILEILRERDFGSSECQPWVLKPPAKGTNGKTVDAGHRDFKPKETQESMTRRMDTFLDDIIQPILVADTESANTVAVVSHGIVLSILWRALLHRLDPRNVSLSPAISVAAGSRPLESLPIWSNTAYLEVDLKPSAVPHGPVSPAPVDTGVTTRKLSGHRMLLKTVNGKEHLNNLKRARGGLGSSAFDAKQKSLEGFFKKPKLGGQSQKSG